MRQDNVYLFTYFKKVIASFSKYLVVSLILNPHHKHFFYRNVFLNLFLVRSGREEFFIRWFKQGSKGFSSLGKNLGRAFDILQAQ